MENIKKLIEEINLRKPKKYEQMKFEQDTIKKINLFEKDHQDVDLIKYARIICRNTVERETSLIQETYLKKIDSKYLNSK